MTTKRERIAEKRKHESGAAVATVLLIAFLLLTASVMLLSGVASATRNGTDMLSETKAFYAAESGLQATINALRHRNPKPDYSQALADNGSMEDFITYNCDAGTANQRVLVGQAAVCNANAESYRIEVTDPDNYGAGLTFNTQDVQTKFTSYTPSAGTSVITGSGTTSTVVYTAPTPAPTPPPDPTPTPDPPVEPTPTPEPTPVPSPQQLVITMTSRPATSVAFNDSDTTNDIQPLVDFSIRYEGTPGAVMPANDVINFQVVYTLTGPRTDSPKETIFGKITSVGGVPTVTLDTPTAE